MLKDVEEEVAMTTKTVRTLSIILTMVLLFSGTLFASGAQEDDDVVRIGFAAHSIEVGALFGQLKIGLLETLDASGIDYELIEGAPADSSDHPGMLQILENMAIAGVDYVVVGPTSLELNEPGLMRLVESGVKLVMTDYVRPEAGVPYDDDALTWIVYSHYDMGYLSGEGLMNLLREEGIMNPDIVLLWGPAASEISQQRGDGVLKAIEDAEGMNGTVVYEAHADFSRDLAYTETERALAAYDFDAIVGLNSYMSVSAMEALRANGELDNVYVAGMGGIIDELQAVALGEIRSVPFRNPRSMGRLAAEAILAHLEGREEDIPPTSYSDLPLLTDADSIRDNVPKEMFDVDAFLATQ
jgi:ABC-type sugar transport system substrate-binding protein